MAKSTLEKSRAEILSYFDRFENIVLRGDDIYSVFFEMREEWGLAKSLGVDDFLSFLLSNNVVEMREFQFPRRTSTLFIRGEVSTYSLVAAIEPQGYFSHLSAMYLNSLIENEPSQIYINREQSKKSKGPGKLVQANVDAAFGLLPRKTKNITYIDGAEIHLLNGMNTGMLGVRNTTIHGVGKIKMTSIERTLIDIVVRPAYSGGIDSVLMAYRYAAGRFSAVDLHRMLESLNYTYPYYQSIGFLLDYSGKFTENDLLLFESNLKEIDFYLEHEMKNPNYSSRWKIYYPYEWN